jgi:hypothetical protein
MLKKMSQAEQAEKDSQQLTLCSNESHKEGQWRAKQTTKKQTATQTPNKTTESTHPTNPTQTKAPKTHGTERCKRGSNASTVSIRLKKECQPRARVRSTSLPAQQTTSQPNKTNRQQATNNKDPNHPRGQAYSRHA